MLGRRLLPRLASTAALSSHLRRRPWAQAFSAKGLAGLITDSDPNTVKSYTVRVEGIPDTVGKGLTTADVAELFGAFEPYNISINREASSGADAASSAPAKPDKATTPPGGRAKEGGGKGKAPSPAPAPATTSSSTVVSFQVPCLRYVHEVSSSFTGDESWQERLRVKAEKEQYPVLFSNLPDSFTVEELKDQVENAGGKSSGKKAEGKEVEPLLFDTHVDLLESYAVFRCPNKYSAMGLVQGTYQLTEVAPGKGEAKDAQEGEAAASTDADAPVPSADGDELEEMVGSNILYNYPAWKTYPVRVNNLAPQTTGEEVVHAFRKYMPYDVEFLPTSSGAEGPRSAYIRFARAEQGKACVEAMNGFTLHDKILAVRPAWQKLYPVVVRGVAAGPDALSSVMEALKEKDVTPVDGDVMQGGPQDTAVVVRFDSFSKVKEAMRVLQMVGSRPVTVKKGWRDFTVSMNNVPIGMTEEELRRVVHLTSPYEVNKLGPGRAALSYFTRAEAEVAVGQLCASGIPDLKMRKDWAVYRLTVKGLPADVTKEEIIEVLKGYEPFRVEFLRSRKGNLKGEAELRFTSQDKMMGAIDRLYGKTSPIEEAHSRQRFEASRIPSDPLDDEEEGEDTVELPQLTEEERRQNEEELIKAELARQDRGTEVAVNPFGIYPEGQWAKVVVDTDMTQKVVKGGQVLSYRCLVVVGNLNGSAGWGIGKGATPEEAKIRAFRASKKNLIHVDLYRGRCIAVPLMGKHNSCRVMIKAGNPRRPSMEGRMINDILRVFGVECGEARSIGRRNPYSVVRAVFNAMSQHQGVEEVARKRGRRLISVSKARSMGL